MSDDVMNVVVAGLGGQGVLTASDILAEAAFSAGYDVKKSEIHGMSQRGGSVASDVRFGKQVFSPMVPEGQAHFLLVLAEDQAAPNRHLLAEDGVVIVPSDVDASKLANPKSLNVCLLGVLSRRLPIDESHWQKALAAHLPAKILDVNLQAFRIGRSIEPGRTK